MKSDCVVTGCGEVVRTLLVLALLGMLGTEGNVSGQTAPAVMTIEVVRDQSTPAATMGQMSVNGSKLCYSLEPPVGGGPLGKGPIPEGTYTGHLRYDKNDKWRIQLDDVPLFQGIQIHIGNHPSDTAGCILVGMEREVQNGKLTKSTEAYKALKKAFYGTDEPKSTPNKKIVVVIKKA